MLNNMNLSLQSYQLNVDNFDHVNSFTLEAAK